MTKKENKIRIKCEALNKIKKLYNPKTKHNFTYYDEDGSAMEQISFMVKEIIQNMEKQLFELKQQNL